MVKIAVIGCGAIGLTSALEIQKKLGNIAKVTIFADKFSPDTTSDIAAGLWEPYLCGDHTMEEITGWARHTYDCIVKLWKEGKAKEAGIILQPNITLIDQEPFIIPEWLTASMGYSELTDHHLKSLNKQYKKKFAGGFVFMTFTWEAATFLPYLQKEFLKRNGTIIEKHVKNFNELEEFDVIVNCTGLEARNLLEDPEIYPIRGQVNRVDAPWSCVSYIIPTTDIKDYCYIIPNINAVVLGGTQQRSFDTTLCEDDNKLFRSNIFKIVPSFADSKVIKVACGLRPVRSKIRLEEECMKLSNGKLMKIVHNYGHGGAGITLSVGCAKQAANLVDSVLKITRNKL